MAISSRTEKNEERTPEEETNITTTRPIGLSELIKLVPSVNELLPVNSNNTKCARQSKLILSGAENLEIWALSFLDSWGKYPSGFLSGNGNQFGDFDQCISIRGEVIGKYCLASFNLRLPKQLHRIDQLVHSHYAMVGHFSDPGHRLPKFSLFHWGFCIPSECSAADLQTTLQIVSSPQQDVKVEVSVTDRLCYTNNDTLPSSRLAQIFAILFFSGLILLCITGTISGIQSEKVESEKLFGKHSALVEAFSIPENFKTLTDVRVSPGNITSLHGLRFLNAIALLLSHKHMALIFTPYINRTSMALTIGRAWATIGRTAIIYTDSFILLSGLLTTISLLKELEKRKRINMLSNITSRLIRLTPNLIVTIIFCTLVMPSLNSGPQWNLVVTRHAQLCSTYWWRNVLYIHNMFGFEQMCLTHTHQLGIDMQLFLISPVLVYSLWRWKKFGAVILVFLSFFSTCLRFIVTFNRRLSPVVYFGVPISRLFSTADFSYILPTHRLTVYCIGIAMGFYFHFNKKPFTLNKITIGWIVCTSCGLLAMCGPYHMSRIGYVYNPMEAALYSSLSPIIWSIFICWLIISSANGYAGYIGLLLQWKGFIIFTRIAYAVYLTQFPIFFYNVGTKRVAEHYTLWQLFNVVEFGVIVVISAIMTIMVDLPCQKLRRLLLLKEQGEMKTKVFDIRTEETDSDKGNKIRLNG